VFRVVRGPQADRFDDHAWFLFTTRGFAVSAQSNRLGIRLDGPPILPNGGADIISEGIVTGAIQITGQGQPIVMLPSRATIGGYPKIATVIAADLDRLGQLQPGDTIRFDEVAIPGARG
jgi:allophanate hydrolase subunit 2